MSTYRIWFESLEDRFAPSTTNWQGGASGSWNAAANWSSGVPTATVDAVFPTAGTYSVTLDAAQSAKGVSFAAGANVSISSGSGSNTLMIGSDGIAETGGSATTDSLSANIALSTTQTWNVAGGNALTVSGNVTDNASPLMMAGAGNITFSGIVSSGGGLVKGAAEGDTGTLTLTSANTYSGGTTISKGTLLVNNTSGSGTGTGTLTVSSGGTLGGTGSFTGTLTVNSGGTVAPGVNGPGILGAASATFTSGSTYSVNLDGATAGSGYSQLNVTGSGTTITLGGSTLGIALGVTPALGDTYTIMNNGGGSAIAGTFNGLAEGATDTVGGCAFTISYQGGNGQSVVLTCVKTTTLATVTSSANPAALGQSVTFTATVTTGSGTFDNGGTVQFAVDGSNFGAALSLSGGRATIADATLSGGTHTITASYSGDTNFSTSSGTLSGGQWVTFPNVVVTTTADRSSINVGSSAGYTVTIRNTGSGSANGVTLTDPLAAGADSDINWTIDPSKGNPSDFQITGAVGSQVLSLNPSSITLAAGASISVHYTGLPTANDIGTSTNPALNVGGIASYAVLYEGTGNNQLSISNNTVDGNIGGGGGQVQFNGPGTIGGRLDFSAANSGQFHNTNGSNVGPTAVHYNVSAVTTAINAVNSLSTALGGLSGTNISFNNANQTVNESSGVLHTNINGVSYRVFNVTSYSETNSNTVTIVGDGSGDPVVFNFAYNSNTNLGGQVALSGTGLTDDQVMWNFTSSGKQVSLNNNGGTFIGVILAPNDKYQSNSSHLYGRVYGGAAGNMQIVSGANVYVPIMTGTLSNAATVSATGLSAQTATATVQITVNQAPTITWTAPAAITYGTALSATQLNATASVAGSLVYSPAAATVLGAGQDNLSVIFTPTDTTDYTTVTATVSITVNQATPAITWSNPAAITYGTALSTTQLNATASVAGSLVYSPATATVLGAGQHGLTVTFTPTNATDYTTATATVSITVNQATPAITWSNPAAITYGTALSATQLNATASVAGSLVYSPAAATVLGPGQHDLTVTFTPTDATDYTTATATVSITVNQATPAITWSNPAAIAYGTALSATQLNATASVAGSLVYSPAAATVLGLGQHDLTVTFTPTDTTDYTTATATVSITVNQATPAITWSDPAAITYGTALSATQLNATASVAGSLVYSPAAATVLGAGQHDLTVTFTPTDATDYTTATATVSITVNQATPAITWSNPAAITYGTALSATQLNATASVAGTFTYSPAAAAVLGAGQHDLTVTFTPTDSIDYTTATATVTITVNQATTALTVTWSDPAAITYGTALSATQLNATASVAGSLVYSPALATVLGAGRHELSVTFTPTDTTNYTAGTATVTITVNQATPTITWSNPAAITYGTALSATQLNATASVAGSLDYSPAAATVLGAGQDDLSVIFTPTDTTDYTTATATVSITVNQATPAITWSNPADITYGTALSATQLNATASVAGSLVYSPAAATLLGAGQHDLTVTFTPADTTDYTTATVTVSITVNQATPAITWSTPADITYGTALSATQLNATASVAGSLVYSPAAATVLGAGQHDLTVTFTPTDTTDYTTATATVSITVNQATPAITWSNPAAITYGTALSATQLNATASVAGTFTYSPAAATLLGAGQHDLSVTFTPTDTTDYTTATATVSIIVNQATPTITWSNPADIIYGTALTGTQLNATASVAGSLVYSPAAANVLGAGQHDLSVTFKPTDTTDYTTATATVTITVNQATPAITWSNPAAITYGTALSDTQLDASTSMDGTFTYTPASGTVLGAGTNQALSVIFTPTDTTDYTSATASVSINVSAAALSITANDGSKVYGQTITFAGTEFTAGGLVNGDTVTGVTLTSTGAAATAGMAGSPYAIVPSAASGSGLANYTITYHGGSLTVTQASTTTTLTTSVNPSVLGQSVTFTATVAAASPGSGTPTGIVTFADNGVALATAALSAGTATFATSSLAVASHSIAVGYGGDTNFLATTSDTLPQAVSKAGTVATVTSSANPQVLGRSVTLTATISAVSPGVGMPAGTVTFQDGGSALGTGAINASGVVTFTTGSLTVGSHAVTAVYGSDSNFNSSTSPTCTQAISAATLTWTGGDGSNNWTAPGNWVGPDSSENQVTPQAGDDLVFAGSTRLSNTNDTAAGTVYKSITFSSGGFTITGNALTIASGITADNASGTTDSLNVAVTFSTAAPVITVSTAGAALSLGGSVNNGGLLVTVAGAGNVTMSGVVSGSGGLTLNGTGTVVLAGTTANTFSGLTTVSSGEFDLNKTAGVDAVGGAGVTVSGGVLKDLAANQINDAATVTVHAGTWNLNANSETVAALVSGQTTGTVTSGTAATLTISGAGNASFAGTLTGALALTKNTGTGTLTLAGANSYSGATTITTGTLQVGSGGTTGTLGTDGVTNNAALVFNRTNTLTVGNNISGNGTLTQTGTGTLILTGTNSYSGATTITTGTLQVGSGGTTGTLGTDGVTNNAALVFNRTNTLTVGNNISGNGTLTQTGTGTLILTGTNSYSGATIITTGTLQVGSGGTTGTLGTDGVTNNAALIFNCSNMLTVSNTIGGNGTLTQAGTGTLVLTGANSYSGGTTLNAGTLQVAANSTVSNNVLVSGPLGTGTLNWTGASTLQADDGNARVLANAVVQTNNIAWTFASASGNGSITLDPQGTGHGMSVTTSSLYVNTTTIIKENITGGDLVFKGGTGTLVLGGQNTFTTGYEQIMGPAVLVLASSTVGSPGNVTSGPLGKTSTQKLSAGVTIEDDGAARTEAYNLNLNGQNVTFGSAGTGTLTWSGVISDGGAVTKTTAGTLALTAANSYSGATTVKAGTLLVGANAPSGANGALGNATSAVLMGDTSGSADAALLTSDGFTVGRAITVQAGNTGTITLGGSADSNSTFSGAVTLNKSINLSLVTTGTNAVTFSGVIAGAGYGVTKVGTGMVTLSGANTYGGGTTISAGTLQEGASNVLADSGPVTVNGGTLAMGSSSDTVGAVTLVSGSITGTTGVLSGSSYAVQSGTISRDPGRGRGCPDEIHCWHGDPDRQQHLWRRHFHHRGHTAGQWRHRGCIGQRQRSRARRHGHRRGHHHGRRRRHGEPGRRCRHLVGCLRELHECRDSACRNDRVCSAELRQAELEQHVNS